MNIVQIAPHFPPTFVGGVELYTRRVADWLSARGHTPTVLCIERVDQGQEGDVGSAVDTARGYEVHRLSVNLGAGPDPFLAKYHDRAIELWLARIFSRLRPDVVHLHSGYLLGGAALSAASRHHIPTVVTLHDFWFVCPRVTMLHPNGSCCSGPDSAAKCAWCLATERRRWRLPDQASNGLLGRMMINFLGNPKAARILRWQDDVDRIAKRRESLLDGLTQADAILAPSRFLLEQTGRAGFSAGRITILPYGIEIRPPSRTRTEPRGRTLRIGYLGQVAPHKGVHVLIEAVRALPAEPLEVRIYGQLNREPAYVTDLQRLAAGDSRIVFAGPYDQSQVEQVLSTLDVTVVPSVWYENSPFVIHEAHAAGVPVVASRLGGMSELVEDESSGLLFRVGDAEDLARQIKRLVAEADLLPRLRAGIRPVRTFAQEMTELLALYERLARSRRQPGPSESPYPRGPASGA